MKENKRYFDENGVEVIIEEQYPEKKTLSDRVDAVCEVIRKNKDILILLTPVLLAGNSLLKHRSKSDTRKIFEERQSYYYDPKTGIKWRLKKPLTNRQNQLLMYRRACGEDIYTILLTMGCLK